jgi:hypothetical protein
MIDMLKSNPDVIAVKVGGKLGRPGLDALVELVEKSLAERAKTHMFVEVEELSGIELDALGDYLPRAISMLGKLDRFGRIAVVSDQMWVRAATRLESALLPHISYEVFESAERDQALAWVEGRSALPHGPAIRIIDTDRPDVLGFEVDGKIPAAEMGAVVAYFDEAVADKGATRLLGRFKHFRGAEIGSFFNAEYYRMKLGMLDRLERYAMVGGPAWLCPWAALLDPLFKVEVRHFPAEQEMLAWEWLGARPVQERSLAA